MDSVLKETLPVSVMREHLERVAVKDVEHNPPLQLQERPHRLTEESQKEISALEEKAFHEEKAENVQKNSSRESARNPRVIYGTLPYA